MVGGVHDLGCGARGGVSAWWVGAEQPLTSSGTFTLGRHGRALDLATSIDQRGGGEGLAADARVRPLPGLQISGGGSSLARTGTVYVRWEDVDVLATGRWKDRAAHAALEYRGARGFGAAIERRWTEPEPESRPAGAADAVAPWLRWRATSLRLTARGLGAAWSAGGQYGEGEQGLGAWRSGGPDLVSTGPVSGQLLGPRALPGR